MEPSEIARVIAEQERDRELILLIRHAHRERITIPTIEAAFGAPLTDRGRSDSRTLGAQLETRRPLQLFHSPVTRCEDTASLIAEGCREAGGEAHLIGPRPFLGAQFIKDGERIIRVFAEMGLRGFMSAWFKGTLDPAIIEDRDRAGRGLLLDLLGEHIAGDEAPLDVHVTHDITVLTLLGLFLDASSPDIPWPDYLDGLVLGLQRSRITWWYRGLEGELPMSTVKSWHPR